MRYISNKWNTSVYYEDFILNKNLITGSAITVKFL